MAVTDADNAEGERESTVGRPSHVSSARMSMAPKSNRFSSVRGAAPPPGPNEPDGEVLEIFLAMEMVLTRAGVWTPPPLEKPKPMPDFGSMSVKELKAELKRRGIDISSRGALEKSELIALLQPGV